MSQFLKRQIKNKQQKLCKKLARLTFFFINGGLSASLSLFSTSKAQDFHVYEAILKICSRCGRTSRTKCAALVILTISWKASDHHQKLFKAVNICNKEEFLWNRNLLNSAAKGMIEMWVILAKTKLPQFGKFFPVFCLICKIVWRRVKNDVKIFCWNKRRFRRFFFMFTFHVSSNSGISVPYFSKDFDQTKGFRFSSKEVLILATKLLLYSPEYPWCTE